jgi:hypothetical protein
MLTGVSGGHVRIAEGSYFDGAREQHRAMVRVWRAMTDPCSARLHGPDMIERCCAGAAEQSPILAVDHKIEDKTYGLVRGRQCATQR